MQRMTANQAAAYKNHVIFKSTTKRTFKKKSATCVPNNQTDKTYRDSNNVSTLLPEINQRDSIERGTPHLKSIKVVAPH